MSLRRRFFQRDPGRSSTDLAANLLKLVVKLCKDKPQTLGDIKTEYDRVFKDKIYTKTPEGIAAAIKTLEDRVLAVKVYIQIGNREMTDLLLGLRNSEYAPSMLNEDNPVVSKERLVHLIQDRGQRGVYVRDLEGDYIDFYGTKPSYLPYKSLKELLHRIPDVELVSSGKNLRVRFRPVPADPRRSLAASKIPNLSRGSMHSYTPTTMARALRRDSPTRSKSKPVSSDGECDLTQSVAVPSSSSSATSSDTPATPPRESLGFADSALRGLLTDYGKRRAPPKSPMGPKEKDIMATIISDLPDDGQPLSALMAEFVSISGHELPFDLTPVEYLSKEFRGVAKIENDDGEMRVFKLNSPLLPRRTIADVYTKLALRSNRRPSDRVLKILKDIYKGKSSQKATSVAPAGSIAPDVVEQLKQRLRRGQLSANDVASEEGLSKVQVVERLRSKLKQGPVGYPSEFNEVIAGVKEDPDGLLVEVMESLNLCLKPQNGKMVLVAA